MSKKALAAAFVSGLVFAIGLGVSGMTQPSKVIGFLDLFGGHWDPSLALVMAGAIAIHMPLYRWIRARPNAPVELGTCGPIDDEQTEAGAFGSTSGKLIAGAAIFGVGWGLSGYCPGPAVVSLVSAAPGVLIFVGAVLAGMLVFNFLFEPSRKIGGAGQSSGSVLVGRQQSG
jgi:uncharacterized membrane protein YedE/YeeE